MGTDFGTIAILSLVIFGALEFPLVIIPLIIRRSKVRSSNQPFYDVPVVLSHPVSGRQREQMRSWYFDETSLHRYVRNTDLDVTTRVNLEYPAGVTPILYGKEDIFNPGPGTDWKAVNKANRAILRANKAVLEANQAILEANTAIQDAEDDLEWIDEIAELNKLR